MTSHEIIPLFQGVLTVALLILVLKRGSRTAETRLFCGFLASMSLWGLLIGGMRISLNPAHAVLWEKAALNAIALTAVFFFLFVKSFAKARSRIDILLGGLFLLGTIVLAPTSILVEGMGTDQYGNAPVWGMAFYPWMAITCTFGIAAMVKLIQAHRASRAYEERNRYLYLITGVNFGLIGGTLDILPALGVMIYPGTILANVGFSVITALAIVRYHLLDIRVTFHIGLTYLLTGVLVALPIASLIVAWYYFLVLRWEVSFWQLILPLPLLILIVALVWGRVENLIRRQVHKERHEHLRALEQFSQLKVRPDEPAGLYSLLINLVDSALRPSSTCLLMRKEDGRFHVAASDGTHIDQTRFRLPGDHPVVVWLERGTSLLGRKEFDIFPELQAMTEEDRQTLHQLDAELYCPFGVASLTGILTLGEKAFGQLYSREDIEFIVTLARQVGLELENIRLFEQERAQRQRVERFNLERTTFLDALAHELKTPLTSAVSSSELLSSGVVACSEDVQLLAKDVWASVTNLNQIVNDILEFGRTQRTEVTCTIGIVDLCELLSAVKEEVGSLLHKKRQRLVLGVPDAPVWVKADPSRLKQVLHNLLGNAAKFSPVGSEIGLRAAAFGESVEIEVQDSAEPINPEDREHLFTAYYRGRQAQEKRLPGLGLGLFVSKQLVELQGGMIWLRNSDWKGNIFGVSLPKGGNQT